MDEENTTFPSNLINYHGCIDWIQNFNSNILTNLTKNTDSNRNISSDSDNNSRIIDDNELNDGNLNTFLLAAESLGHYLTFYYTPTLVLTGSIGNILSVFVFFKTKLKKLSSSYYLSALAISDTCFLFGLFVQWLNFIDIYLYNREVLCQFFTFFSSLCSFLSVWFVVAFTVERFIAVMYPLKRQTMCTVKRAKLVLGGLTLIGTIHCMPYIYFASPIVDPNTNSTICDIRLEYKEYMTILNYIDTVIVFVVPFATIVILNAFIGCTVWRFAAVRRTMTMTKRKSPASKSTTTFPITYRAAQLRRQSSVTSYLNGKNSIAFSSKSNRQKNTNSSQVKVTKMLLIVSTVFVCLNLPSYVMRLLAFLETQPSRTTIVIQYICWFLFLTNFGINFVLYCVSGQNFRSAVIAMFGKNSAAGQKEVSTQVTVYIRNGSGSGSGTSRRRTLTHNSSWADVHELKHPGSMQKNLCEMDE